MKQLGDFFRSARTNMGATQREMADRLRFKTKATVVFMENGQRMCPTKHIVKVARVYGVSRRQIETYNFSIKCLALFKNAGQAYSEDLVLELTLLHANLSSKS